MTVGNLQQTLRQLVEQWMSPPLEASGFTRAKQRFSRDTGECIQIIDVQRSVATSKDLVRFTINLGVQSKAVREFFGEGPTRSTSIDDCQWQVRLHDIAPSDVPEWATIDKSTDAHELGLGIRMWLQIYALPTLAQLESDAALVDLWISGVGPGLTRFARLMNLAVLLDRVGRQSDLDVTLAQLDEVSLGKPFAARVADLRDRLSGPS